MHQGPALRHARSEITKRYSPLSQYTIIRGHQLDYTTAGEGYLEGYLLQSPVEIVIV